MLNKMDLLSTAKKAQLQTDPVLAKALQISVATGDGLLKLRQTVEILTHGEVFFKEYFIPSLKLGLISFLYEEAFVLNRVDHENGVTLQVKIGPKQAVKFDNRLNS